jgi:RNA polymerase sigma-70 factor (ECF subfamily)
VWLSKAISTFQFLVSRLGLLTTRENKSYKNIFFMEYVTFRQPSRYGSRVSVFKQFYSDHKDRLFSYLLRKAGNYHLAADIAQESFTRYLERYGEREHNPALLFTIGRNLLLDHIRKNRSNISYEEEEHGRTVDQEHAYHVHEEMQQVMAALQTMKEEERDILSLLAGGGLSYHEIAQITGNSEANIKIKIHRSRVKLKKILEETGQ